MSRYLLDTNICVHFLKAEFDTELLYGVAKSDPARQLNNRQNLDKFLRLFPANRRLGTSAILETYATLKAYLKSIGRLQGEFDMLIGSTAITHFMVLATRNTRHFADMPSLVVEDWTAPPTAPVEEEPYLV